MQRTTALIYALILGILFFLLAYYGMKLRLRAAISLFFLVSKCFFLLFYPASKITTEDADFTLVILVFAFLLGQIWLLGYLLTTIFRDFRQESMERAC